MAVPGVVVPADFSIEWFDGERPGIVDREHLAKSIKVINTALERRNAELYKRYKRIIDDMNPEHYHQLYGSVWTDVKRKAREALNHRGKVVKVTHVVDPLCLPQLLPCMHA